MCHVHIIVRIPKFEAPAVDSWGKVIVEKY